MGNLVANGCFARSMASIVALGALLGTVGTAQAGYVLKKQSSTFVNLRDYDDSSMVFMTENPPQNGFTELLVENPTADPIIPFDELRNYTFSFTSQEVIASSADTFVIQGEYEFVYSYYNPRVPTIPVSSGIFLITMAFSSHDRAELTGELFQQTYNSIDGFADLSGGGRPISFTSDYQHSYDDLGLWSGGGNLRQIEFKQLGIPSVGTIATLGIAGVFASRRRR